jgi:hypothetical protein
MMKLECRNPDAEQIVLCLCLWAFGPGFVIGVLSLLLLALTEWSDSVVIGAMKVLAALLLLALETSCTTVANRRDLYSPQPAPDLDWHRQLAMSQHAETAPPENR